MTIQPLQPMFHDCPRGSRQFGDDIAYASGGSWQVEIPVDGIIEQVIARLDLSVVIGSTPSGYTAHAFNAAEMLRTISVEIGALGIKKSLTGLNCWALSGLRHEAMPTIDSLTTAESNAAGTYAVHCEFPIDFASFGVAPPDLGVLVAKSHNQILLKGTFGTDANMVYGGSGGTIAITGTLKFYRHNLFPRIYDAGGYGHLVESYQDKSIATTGNHEFTLTPFRRHRSVLIVSKAGSPACLSDAVVSSVQIRVESTVFPYNLLDEFVRGRMCRHGAPSNLFGGADMPWTGFLYLDYGKIKTMMPASVWAHLDAGEASQLTLILACTTGTGTAVQVHQSFWED